MSPQREPRDRGLTIHRVLQWVVTVATGLTTTMIASGYGTWEKFKEHMVRMENVPQDVREIKTDLQDVKAQSTNHELRLTFLERAKR